MTQPADIQNLPILIVGSSFSGLRDALHSNGHDYIVLKDKATAKHIDKNRKRRVLCDFTSRESVLQAVGSLPSPVGAVISLYENYVLPAAWICEHLGLPGMPVDAALACTDKYLMRQAFALSPEKVSPDYAVVQDESGLLEFAASHSFPLILKPANLVKSLLVTKSDTLDELLENYRQTVEQIDSVYATYAPNRTPTILVEEFLEGSMHSIAAFADRDGNVHAIPEIVDLQTARDIGFNDNFLYSRTLPSRLTESRRASLHRCAAAGIRALGMRSSPAHVEIILTADGPRIVEIGARNGGYRERMYGMSNGIDLVRATIDITVGEAPSLLPVKHEACAVLELFPERRGSFQHITAADKIAALPSCVYFSVKARTGSSVGRAADGYKRCAIVILHNADETAFRRDLEFIGREARVVVS